MNFRRWLPKVLFIIYCFFILYMTILNRDAKATHSADLRLMWSYREWLSGSATGKKDVWQNIQNILLFIPFGSMLTISKHGWKTVLIGAVTFTLLIEAAQYFFGLGLCELDDVLCNTLGAMIGFWLMKTITRMIEKQRNRIEGRR